MKYNCQCCNYDTGDKANYNKHLTSKKHQLIKSKTKVSTLVSPSKSLSLIVLDNEIFTCKYCDKKYKHKQSVTKHIKYSCTKNKEEDLTELVRLLNVRLENQNTQLVNKDTQLVNKDKQIEKLMGKLEINMNITNIQNNIILLNYKDTDVSHLTDEDYKKCIKKVCFCVLGLIEKVHFNPDKPENMNVYISNMKDKYMMIYQNNKWVLTNKDKLDRLYDDKENMIDDWIQENNDPEMTKFFNRYLDLKKDDKTMQMITDEIKLMMFNNKNLIE
jgi:protein-arginine kinase activator protein McsA